MFGEIIPAAQGNPFAGAKREDIEIIRSDDNGEAPPSSEEDDIEQPVSGQDQGDEQENPETGDASEPTPAETPAKEESKGAPATPPAPVQVPELTMEDAIKKFDKKALLKAIVGDDFAVQAIEHYQATGNLDEYLAVKTVDFGKMTPEQILRYDMQRTFKGLSDKALDAKVAMKMREYGIEPSLTDEELEVPMELFAYDMEQKRKAFIDEQAKYKPPVRQEQSYDPETARQEILKDPVVSGLVAAKTITIGHGDEKLNISFDPENVLPILYDGKALSEAMAAKDAKGNPTDKQDFNLMMEMAVFLKDPAAYRKLLIDFGGTIKEKSKRARVENPSPAETGAPIPNEETLWDAFKRRGVHTGGR